MPVALAQHCVHTHTITSATLEPRSHYNQMVRAHSVLTEYPLVTEMPAVHVPHRWLCTPTRYTDITSK